MAAYSSKMVPSNASKLSKNTLQMKFMQRSVLLIEQQLNDGESSQIVDDEHWVLDLPPAPPKISKFDKEPLYAVCEHLVFGRMSFKGFNPEVEKLMKVHSAVAELKISEEKEKETEVDDNEMANRYSSLIGVIAKKLAKKRQKPVEPDEDVGGKKERTFLKPVD